jgi:hypothetical protein
MLVMLIAISPVAHTVSRRDAFTGGSLESLRSMSVQLEEAVSSHATDSARC